MSAPIPGGHPLHLTVLGSATPYPAPDNPCSGYLVEHAGTRLWVDAGPGTLAALQRHARLDTLDGIWISHLHADHCSDLLTAYYALRYADIERAAPLPLFGPPGIAARLADFLTNGPDRSPVESAFAIRELYDGHTASLGRLRLTSRAVEHGLPAFALRIEADGAALVYSGDCAPCPALTGLAAGCDVLLCEADGTPEGHHTAEQAGDTAATAGAGRLIVTHVGHTLTPDQAVSRASTRYPGPVTHATPGRVFTVRCTVTS
ncbi:MBL fold metallo-hydrolase [Streptomyces sp. NPDC002054]|uniref:MBL fold metallo-hydrolase n=1 Tax=Streptomyces sp. NPDC002054 TaxID=3154663 RepID=UPI003318A70C